MARTAKLTYMYRPAGRADVPQDTDTTTTLAVKSMPLPVRDGSGPLMPFASESQLDGTGADRAPSAHDVLWLREAVLERRSWMGETPDGTTLQLMLPAAGKPLPLYAENLRRVALEVVRMCADTSLSKAVREDPMLDPPAVWPPDSAMHSWMLCSSAELMLAPEDGWTPVFSATVRRTWSGTSVPSWAEDLAEDRIRYVGEDVARWTDVEHWDGPVPGTECPDGDVKAAVLSYEDSGRPVLTPKAVFGMEPSDDFGSLGTTVDAPGLELLDGAPVRAMFSDLERLDTAAYAFSGNIILDQLETRQTATLEETGASVEANHRDPYVLYDVGPDGRSVAVRGMSDPSEDTDHDGFAGTYRPSDAYAGPGMADYPARPGDVRSLVCDDVVMARRSSDVLPAPSVDQSWPEEFRRTSVRRSYSTQELWFDGSDSSGSPDFTSPEQLVRTITLEARRDVTMRAGGTFRIAPDSSPSSSAGRWVENVLANATDVQAVVGCVVSRTRGTLSHTIYGEPSGGTRPSDDVAVERELEATLYLRAVPYSPDDPVSLDDLPTDVAAAPVTVEVDLASSQVSRKGSPKDTGLDGPCGQGGPSTRRVSEHEVEQETARTVVQDFPLLLLARHAPRTSVAANPSQGGGF